MARGGAEKELGEDLGDGLRGGAGEQGERLGEDCGAWLGRSRRELRVRDGEVWGRWLHLRRFLEQMKTVSQSPNVSHYGREPLYKPV